MRRLEEMLLSDMSYNNVRDNTDQRNQQPRKDKKRQEDMRCKNIRNEEILVTISDANEIKQHLILPTRANTL